MRYVIGYKRADGSISMTRGETVEGPNSAVNRRRAIEQARQNWTQAGYDARFAELVVYRVREA